MDQNKFDLGQTHLKVILIYKYLYLSLSIILIIYLERTSLPIKFQTKNTLSSVKNNKPLKIKSIKHLKQVKIDEDLNQSSMSYHSEDSSSVYNTIDVHSIETEFLINSRRKRSLLYVNKKSRKTIINPLEVATETFENRRNAIFNNNIINFNPSDIYNKTANNNPKDLKIISVNNYRRNKTESSPEEKVNLYIQKGIEIYNKEEKRTIAIQTDISGFHVEMISTETCIKSFEDIFKGNYNTFVSLLTQIENIETLFKSSNIISTTSPNTSTKTTSHFDHFKKTKKIIDKLKEDYNSLDVYILKIIDEFEQMNKENQFLRINNELMLEKRENMKETYSEIFVTLVSSLIFTNHTLVSYVEEYETNLSKETINVLAKVVEKNVSIIEEEKKQNIFDFINNVEIKQFTKKYFKLRKLKNIENIEQEEKIRRKSQEFEIKEVKNDAIELIREFKSSKVAYKVLILNKKVVKIINTIYFDLLEKQFTMNDNFDFMTSKEDLPEFCHLPLLYFNNNFNMESLAKRKFMEFLQAIVNNSENYKRISNFKDILQLNQPEHHKDVFVSTQIIQMLHTFKKYNVYVNLSIYNENDVSINLNYKSITECMKKLLEKYPKADEIKISLQKFLFKNKKTKTIKYKIYEVVDFDDFMEFVLKLLKDISSNLFNYNNKLNNKYLFFYRTSKKSNSIYF